MIMEVLAGSDITTVIAGAIILSANKKSSVMFEFNGINVTVNNDSDPKLIYRDWSRGMKGYTKDAVGPYPTPILSDEERENDARIEAENERKRQERHEEDERKAKIKREIVESKLVNAPGIELTDESAWQQTKDKNQDGYGGAVVTYSERWARLMQLEMSIGRNLEDIAEATSYEANLEGITGFQYGCAVSILVNVWKYGEQLCCWRNLDTKIGDEGKKANESGGVLNPAILVTQ